MPDADVEFTNALGYHVLYNEYAGYLDQAEERVVCEWKEVVASNSYQGFGDHMEPLMGCYKLQQMVNLIIAVKLCYSSCVFSLADHVQICT